MVKILPWAELEINEKGRVFLQRETTARVSRWKSTEVLRGTRVSQENEGRKGESQTTEALEYHANQQCDTL